MNCARSGPEAALGVRMNATDFLARQRHETARDFERVRQAADDSRVRVSFQMLAVHLAARVAVEERVFFPAALEKPEPVHERIRRELVHLITCPRGDASFGARIASLEQEVMQHEAHVRALLGEVERRMSSDELDALGESMLRALDEELQDQRRLPQLLAVAPVAM